MIINIKMLNVIKYMDIMVNILCFNMLMDGLIYDQYMVRKIRMINKIIYIMVIIMLKI